MAHRIIVICQHRRSSKFLWVTLPIERALRSLHCTQKKLEESPTNCSTNDPYFHYKKRFATINGLYWTWSMLMRIRDVSCKIPDLSVWSLWRPQPCLWLVRFIVTWMHCDFGCHNTAICDKDNALINWKAPFVDVLWWVQDLHRHKLYVME